MYTLIKNVTLKSNFKAQPSWYFLRMNNIYMIESFLNIYTSITICFMYLQIIATFKIINTLSGDDSFTPTWILARLK